MLPSFSLLSGVLLMKNDFVVGAAVAVCAGVLGVLHPAPARACGGFFCSRAPVDQSGETVVYGMEADGTVTMSVQIQYQGNDEDFAWILPVVAPPSEISVGSEALFDQLRLATNPIFTWESRTEGTCRPYPTCYYGDYAHSGGGGCGMSAASPSEWSGGYVDAGAGTSREELPPPMRMDMGVTVYGEDIVGPYDTVVLGAASAAEVVMWLQAHDYDVPEQSAPLLEPYAEAGHVFVALRLSANRVTGVLRPLTMRIPSSEACLPIRLTQIASVPGMPITLFFLGRHGAAARNFSSVMVDTTDPAFWNGTRTWADAVGEAVDAYDGLAFSTDYSGPTPAVSLTLPPVADLATTSDAAVFLSELRARGYVGDQILLELFERFIEPPGASDAQTYYNCLADGSISTCGEPARFDPAGLATAITEQIVTPRERAQEMVYRHGHLTRLFTRMDPEQMTMDPVFFEGPEVPDVSNVHEATLVTECSNEHYVDEAPTAWDIEGVRTPRDGGRIANDDSYCRARGGSLTPPPESDDDSGGCSCGVAGVATQGGLIGGAFLLLLVRRWRLRKKR